MQPYVLVLNEEECSRWLDCNDASVLRGVVSVGDPGSPPPPRLDRLRCPALRLEFLDCYDSGAAEGKTGPSSVGLTSCRRWPRGTRQRPMLNHHGLEDYEPRISR